MMNLSVFNDLRTVFLTLPSCGHDQECGSQSHFTSKTVSKKELLLSFFIFAARVRKNHLKNGKRHEIDEGDEEKEHEEKEHQEGDDEEEHEEKEVSGGGVETEQEQLLKSFWMGVWDDSCGGVVPSSIPANP